MTELSTLLSVIQALEIQLHNPALRLDANRVDKLLHDDFEEVGRSGQCYNKVQTIAALKNESQHLSIYAEDFVLTMITTETVLLRYKSFQRDIGDNVTRRTERSSIWVLSPSGPNGRQWQMRFHQGTAINH
ncbi:nuclear transport factor 2 family protein [uncultured Cedecea sp.]|uniref:nuclear transport factor 2 family protein n=1 Tax=uncultured Cedecea sp. TaxID=988762 RepID=UPI0026298D6F|nr:nuclear transport factor 2 family protein [uncultured Cedecea sp.]